MGSLRKMGAFLGLVAHDDPERGHYEYADEGYEADYAGGEFQREYPQFGGRTPAAASPAAEPVVEGALAVQLRPQAHRATETGTSARPLTVKLTGFAEARIIGERYRDGSSVILDMTDLTDSDARRVVDFAAGLAFALHGSIDKVTARVFMLLPPHADMSAEDRRAALAGGWNRG